MKRGLYQVGRGLQLMALIALPSAFWITQFERDERQALTIFLGAIFVFFVGYLLTLLSSRL
jgi:hypothetical protein